MPQEDISRNVGFLLHDVSRLLRKQFDARARELGMTRAQWRVLAHLGPREGINQTALAEILEVESITLGRHIDRLEEAGWVERRADPNDRRAWQLYLSDRAQPTLDLMREIAAEAREVALEGMRPAGTAERTGGSANGRASPEPLPAADAQPRLTPGVGESSDRS